ncbi:hypothetical protein [Stygiolobus sp. RP850M]|jgi:hypothetical protein|uniref:hypothetical protein n=1 Tax=Stygiolobus sp. RP850M TaxID=3133137 RepID=UPI00307D5916
MKKAIENKRTDKILVKEKLFSIKYKYIKYMKIKTFLVYIADKKVIRYLKKNRNYSM